MKLVFSWYHDFGPSGGFYPGCEASPPGGPDGVSILACLLTDDGGIGHESTIAWLNTGLEMAASVGDGAAPGADWARETWGARIGPEGTVLYSLYDESFTEAVSTAAFLKALISWKGFISQPPGRNISREIEV